jgi:Flp pilus assembly pilin Flp
MRTFLSTLIAHDLGVTAIEYAMIGSLIAIVGIAAKASIGGTLSGIFASVSSSL